MNPACSTPADAVGKGDPPRNPRESPIVGPPVVALLTAPGRSALAVVAIDGRASVEILSRFFRPKGLPLADRGKGSVVFGQWGQRVDDPLPMAGRMPPEDLVVVKRSATSLEVHPHGGLAASSRVLADLESAGCRRLAWPDWLAATGCSDFGCSEIEVEARVALAAATGPKAAAILCRQLSARPGDMAAGAKSRQPGLLESEIAAIRRLAADGNRAEAVRRTETLLAWSPLGLRLTRPWRVVVAGRPNAGKSSLVNALAGFARSLVAGEPGTTRDLLETRVVLDGWEIDLVDTAGLRDDPASPTEQAGIDRARAAAVAADLVLWVINGDERGFSIADASGEQPEQSLPPLFVLTKIDLPDAPALADLPSDVIRTSAVTGEGIDTLAHAIVRRLVPREPGPLDAVPFTPRQVSEIQSLTSPSTEARGARCPTNVRRNNPEARGASQEGR